MTRRRQVLIAVALGMVGLWGLSLVAMGEGGATAAARTQYDARLARVDKNKADDLYGLARWCLANGLPDEARANALAVLEKAPDDVRAKYLLFALTGSKTTGGTGGEDTVTVKQITIADDAAAKVYTDEGAKQIISFGRDIQPILISKCGTPKCHGDPKHAKWSLIAREVTDRRTIAENFQTISKYLNRDSLAESRLFTMPLKGTESGHPARVFPNTNDRAYGVIETWAKTLKSDISRIWSAAATTPTPTVTP